MFLFQGKFGNIFYTGDFRYNPDVLEHPILKSVIDNECVNRLYLDNTFAAEHCKFPPREKVLQDIISLIRRYPEHHVVIGVRKLGKEEVLRAIALALKEKVLVSKERLKILCYLQYEDVFTTNPEESRIHVKEMHQINSLYLRRLQEEKGPVLTVLLTALYSVVPPGFKCTLKLKDAVSGVHHLPYSDHSCHTELVEFVSKIKPHTIYPIVKMEVTDCAKREDQDLSDNSDVLLQKCTWNNSVIPRSILDLSKEPMDTNEFSSEIPDLAVENLPFNSIQNQRIVDDSWSDSQSPVLVPRQAEGFVLQRKCNQLTSDSSSSAGRGLNESGDPSTCQTSKHLEDEYAPISDEELTQMDPVPCTAFGQSDNDLRKNSDTDMVDSDSIINQKKLEMPPLPMCRDKSSSVRSKTQLDLQNPNDSEKSQYFSCPTSIPPEMKDNKSILSQTCIQTPNSESIQRDLDGDVINRINLDQNGFRKDIQVETSLSQLVSYQNFKSSLNPKLNCGQVSSTPYEPQNSVTVQSPVLTSKFLKNNVTLEKNLNHQSKTKVVATNSENHSSLVMNLSGSDSESESNRAHDKSYKNPVKENRFHFKNLRKNIDISKKFGALLGNICKCDSDSDCFCKAVANQRIPSPSSEDSSVSLEDNPSTHCAQLYTKRRVVNKAIHFIKVPGDNFYSDINKNNIYSRWKRSALKSQTRDKNIWREYNWQKIFADKKFS
ncbi:uncharacterized protein LOC124367331 isoform X2 [Homalodisca vitripennis]|nr:uncharacterized protein LOC124367331 isoform X2 [Homalodisca vitripennis]